MQQTQYFTHEYLTIIGMLSKTKRFKQERIAERV